MDDQLFVLFHGDERAPELHAHWQEDVCWRARVLLRVLFVTIIFRQEARRPKAAVRGGPNRLRGRGLLAVVAVAE